MTNEFATLSPCACPSCGSTMSSSRFARQNGGELVLDLCFDCQGIWFDSFESAQMAAAGVLQLFQQLHEKTPSAVQAWRDVLHCPRCKDRLAHGLDRSKNGQFAYERCLQGHGRFTAFSAFFMEKGFVRQLNGSEITELAKKVQIVRCSGCGAPIDIRTQSACIQCRAPISILDPQAIDKALDGYNKKAAWQAQAQQPLAIADAIIANQRMQSQQRRLSLDDDDMPATDLVTGAARLFWKLLA